MVVGPLGAFHLLVLGYNNVTDANKVGDNNNNNNSEGSTKVGANYPSPVTQLHCSNLRTEQSPSLFWSGLA